MHIYNIIHVLLSTFFYMFRRLLRHPQEEVYLCSKLLLYCLITDLKLHYIWVYKLCSVMHHLRNSKVNEQIFRLRRSIFNKQKNRTFVCFMLLCCLTVFCLANLIFINPLCTMVDGGRLSYCRSLSPKGWSPTTYRHDTAHFIQPLKPLYFGTPCCRFTVCSKNELPTYTRIDLAVRIQLVRYWYSTHQLAKNPSLTKNTRHSIT